MINFELNTEQNKLNKKRDDLEKEVSPEEKTEAIKEFIESNFEEKFSLGIKNDDKKKFLKNKEKELKKWIADISSSEIKNVLGENIDFIYKLVSARKEMDKEKDNISQLIKQGGDGMLPVRVRYILNLSTDIFKYIYLKKKSYNDDEYKEKSRKIIDEQSKEIEKDIFLEKEEKESINVEGFEVFNYPDIKGKEFVEKAMQFLPKEILGKNIKGIKYADQEKPMPKFYYNNDSIKRRSEGKFNKETGEIAFFKLPVSKDKRVEKFPFRICHEGGHSLDPRYINQENLSLSKQIEMMKEWEETRKEESEFSPYALEIKNEDKILETRLKSKESFADTIKKFLTSPKYLKDNYPKRFEFCRKWLEKQFPEENFTQTEEIGEGPTKRKIYSRPSNLRSQYDHLLQRRNIK